MFENQLRNIPFSPPDISEAEIEAVAEVLRSGWITTGPKTKFLERQISQWIGTEKCVCLNSQTACAEMVLRMLGICGGDEVCLPAYTYTASASVVDHVGAKIVMIDCQKGSFEMDYDALEAAITEKTKAIIPVDFGGVPCDYDRIFDIVERKRHLFKPTNDIQKAMGRIAVCADTAHAFGAKWHGKMIGSVADFSSFSFHAVKNLTTAEGGALTWRSIDGISDETIYRQMQLLSLHGQSKDALSKTQLGAWEYDVVGPWYKCNMTDTAAAIGIKQFERYPQMLERRREIIDKYDNAFKPLGVEVLDHYNAEHESSGHLYITLKDDGGVLKAVMFKAAAASLTFKPEDGMKVIARGRIGVYEQSGTYQLYISEMTPDGLGELYVSYEQLKKKLGEEGLFDDDKKKPIPQSPEKLGVITAATGAAVRDIINVITRRYPYCEIIIYPAQVQGAGAKESIVAGIEYFNEKERCDTLIVGRGGGSIEDLWAFNEEIVARAIFNSEIPIISAVGHETDFTIADFVADLRAPTPSAAAEVAVPSQLELLSKISTMKTRMQQAVINGLKNKRLVIEKLSMRSPKNRIDDLRQKNDNLLKQAEKSFLLTFEGKKKELAKYLAKLDALSPLGVMARGYAIATEEDGTVIRTISKMSPGKEFSLRLADGECQCEVKEI